MRLKAVLVFPLSLCLFGLIQAVTTASSNDRCALPPDLRDEISKQYPGTHIVILADLDEYKRKLFHKDHGTRCPGLVKVNFYGDGKPTWAFVLISGENPKRKAELVVARHIADRWETHTLETTDGTPVVWSEGPGKYDGISDPKTIRAKYPVIIFCGYESWAIVYAWTGKEVEKTWISD
jgi:hypothetical protein